MSQTFKEDNLESENKKKIKRKKLGSIGLVVANQQFLGS